MRYILAILTSLLMVFAVVELITRLSSTPSALEPDAALGWVYRPGEHQVRKTDGKDWDFRTNAAGLRAPEGYGAGNRGANESRILLLGDSFTLGWGLDSHETFASVLEERLAKEGRPATVIPAGTEGYSTDQECLWLENRGVAYQPNVVVVLPYANDVVWNAQERYLAFGKPRFDDAAGTASTATDHRSAFVKYSRLINKLASIRMAMGSVLEVPGGGRMQLDDWVFLKSKPPEAEAGWKKTEAIAKRMVAKGTAMGAKVVCAPIPNRFESHMEDGVAFESASRVPSGGLDFTIPARRFGEVFTAAGATVLDTVGPVKAAAASGQRLYFQQDWHFNAAGAQVFANALYDGLAKANLLPPSGAAKANHPTLASASPHHAQGGIPTWLFVVGGLWIVLTIAFKLSYPDENPLFAALKVACLLGFVVGVFTLVGYLGKIAPPGAMGFVVFLLVGGIAIYGIVKTAPRFGTIGELFKVLVDRGHWYLVPVLVVMLTISILLVVAQNPVVAPFIYTLF